MSTTEKSAKDYGSLGGKKVLRKYGKKHFKELAKKSHAPGNKRAKNLTKSESRRVNLTKSV
jgi:hypothetical protein